MLFFLRYFSSYLQTSSKSRTFSASLIGPTTVAHNCNCHIKTKCSQQITNRSQQITNCSQQITNHSQQIQIAHSKFKSLTANSSRSQQIQESAFLSSLNLLWAFGFDVTVQCGSQVRRWCVLLKEVSSLFTNVARDDTIKKVCIDKLYGIPDPPTIPCSALKVLPKFTTKNHWWRILRSNWYCSDLLPFSFCNVVLRERPFASMSIWSHF